MAFGVHVNMQIVRTFLVRQSIDKKGSLKAILDTALFLNDMRLCTMALIR